MAGVPQGGNLSPYLYLLYTADVPVTDGTVLAMYADDKAVLAVSRDYNSAIDILQVAIDRIIDWMTKWKIRANGEKSVHVDFALRSHSYSPITIGDRAIPHAESTKYLGMHLDSRLTWSRHINAKKVQMREKMRSLYWLIGPQSVLSIESKRLLYLAIIKPIWIYGIALWGCASKSNIAIIQRCQNVILRKMVNAYRYKRNDALHRDLKIDMIESEIRKFATRHEDRLSNHSNPTAIELLDNTGDVRRLKRFRPSDLPIRRL